MFCLTTAKGLAPPLHSTTTNVYTEEGERDGRTSRTPTDGPKNWRRISVSSVMSSALFVPPSQFWPHKKKTEEIPKQNEAFLRTYVIPVLGIGTSKVHLIMIKSTLASVLPILHKYAEQTAKKSI